MATLPNPNDERWMPRCPKCGEGSLLLAPANQYTRLIADKLDVYCPHCQWIGGLGANLKMLYVRL